jgi:endo-1,4-beta-xylanase
VSSQLATNPGFENGLTGWTTLNANGATITANTVAADAHSGSGSMKVVNPTAQTGNQWKVQVSSTAFSTTIGKQYVISYWVKAATAGGAIRLSTGPSSAQYQADQAIGTAWQQVSWTITASLASTTFLFDMGQVANTYYIDDVSVKEVNAGGTWQWVKLKSTTLSVGPHTLTIGYNTGGGTQLDKMLVTTSTATITGKGASANNCSVATATATSLATQGIAVYPNPAKEKITIELGANQLHVKTIEVVDVLGRVQSQVSVGAQTTLTIPSDKLKPGVYLLRFKGDTTKAQRVLIQ